MLRGARYINLLMELDSGLGRGASLTGVRAGKPASGHLRIFWSWGTWQPSFWASVAYFESLRGYLSRRTGREGSLVGYCLFERHYCGMDAQKLYEPDSHRITLAKSSWLHS